MTSNTNFKKSRRKFLQRATAIGVGLPIAGLFGSIPIALADDAPHLSEDDPTATALKYVHDASASEARSNADHVCDNCQHYSGAAGSDWGPCALFPGKQVAAKGWCSAWVKKP